MEVKNWILYYIFDPTHEGILTLSKRCSRNFFFFTSILTELLLNFEDNKTLGKSNFFGILSSKLLLSLPCFLGRLNQNVSKVDTCWCNMDTVLICTYWMQKMTLRRHKRLRQHQKWRWLKKGGHSQKWRQKWARPQQQYLIKLLMTPHLDRHSKTNTKPDMLSAV